MKLGDEVAIAEVSDGRWVKLVKEIEDKEGNKIPINTPIYVVKTSTTDLWTVADDDGNTRELSKRTRVVII